jgi:hypothetical protein
VADVEFGLECRLYVDVGEHAETLLLEGLGHTIHHGVEGAVYREVESINRSLLS